jgi:MFS family permease
MACLLLGFAMHAISGYGLISWMPTFFQRTYGWNPGDAGILYGTMNATLGSFGAVFAGWLADRLRARGHADSRLRVGVLFPIVGNETATVTILAFYACFSSFALGLGPVAVQEVMPNQMRGQASALYILALAFLGLTVGPTGVALLTDYVFADETALNHSMAIVAGLAMPTAATLLWLGRKPFVQSLAGKEHWLSQQ